MGCLNSHQAFTYDPTFAPILSDGNSTNIFLTRSRYQLGIFSGNDCVIGLDTRTFPSPISAGCFVWKADFPNALIISTMDGEVYILSQSESGTWSQTDRLKRFGEVGTFVSGLCAIDLSFVLALISDGGVAIFRIDVAGKLSGAITTLHISKGCLHCVSALKVSDHSTFAFCGGNDPYLHLVQIRVEGTENVKARSRGAFIAHASSINTTDTSESHGGIIATGSDDRTVRIWSLKDISKLANMSEDVPHETHIMKHAVLEVRFSKPHDLLAAIANNELLVIRLFPDGKSHFFSQPVVHQMFCVQLFSICWSTDDTSITVAVDGDPPQIVKLIPPKNLNLSFRVFLYSLLFIPQLM
jgi:WD40 repeat protein